LFLGFRSPCWPLLFQLFALSLDLGVQKTSPKRQRTKLKNRKRKKMSREKQKRVEEGHFGTTKVKRLK
jgi:hypothetical protein